MSLYTYDTLPNPGDECEEPFLVKKPAKEPRCRAKTRHGTMCHKRSVPGRSYCHIHTLPNNTEYRMCATCYASGVIKTTELVTFFHYSGTDINLCNKHFVDMCEASWPK